MRKIALYITMCLLLAACGKKEKEAKGERLTFTEDVRLATTPVKDQGRTSLCWLYAMLATIESEHIAQGDSVNLSADYLARAFLREQATEGYMSGQQDITERGMATMTLRLLQTYGLTHYDAFHRPKDSDLGVLRQQLTLARGNARSLTDYSQKADQLLDRAIGQAMPTVFFLGAKYTPLEFAHSVCREGEYVAMTSFTHHPFGQRIALEVPDNRYHDTFLNVPLDTLYNKVVRTLLHGHPVCWEGDTSEPGFSFANGVARLDPQAEVSQAERQRQFESHETTDDHCMAIVGLAHDQHGHRYFLMKNSWGTRNPYGGFIYVSEEYLKMKTIAIILPT